MRSGVNERLGRLRAFDSIPNFLVSTSFATLLNSLRFRSTEGILSPISFLVVNTDMHSTASTYSEACCIEPTIASDTGSCVRTPPGLNLRGNVPKLRSK